MSLALSCMRVVMSSTSSVSTDNIKRCTYLVIHEVDELRLTTVGVEFKLIGLSELRVECGELRIGVANVVDRLSE